MIGGCRRHIATAGCRSARIQARLLMDCQLAHVLIN